MTEQYLRDFRMRPLHSLAATAMQKSPAARKRGRAFVPASEAVL
jgi:hypothetical protein